jgi:xylulokinase
MDWTNASLTLLFETGGSKRWSTGLCEDIGIPVKKLPELKASWEVVGEVTRKASSETGLAKGIPVTAGGADTASAALGLGVVEHGDAMEDAGTATKLAICVDRPLFLRETLNRCHVVPDRWLLVAASSATGAALRWLKEQLGEYDKLAVATKRKNPYELMDRDAARSLPGARGLILLPYLAPGGERSPIWDPYARGVIFGLTLSHTKGDLIRAFLEASAYALMHNIETVEGYSVRIRSLRVSGGQARSRLWRSIKADITRKPVELTSRIEATVFGTALLAGVGSGHYSDLRSVAKRLVHVKERIHPHRAHKLIYHRSFAIYKLLYEKLKEEFRKLAIEGAHLKS